jgi:hypothetical protein
VDGGKIRKTNDSLEDLGASPENTSVGDQIFPRKHLLSGFGHKDYQEIQDGGDLCEYVVS